jgi:hypothetical protein
LIEARLQLFQYKIEDHRLILFLSLMAQSPGNAVMYLWYLQYWSKKNGFVYSITLENLCELFPMGFPSLDDMSKIWDSQKVHLKPDNLVDHMEYGASLFKGSKEPVNYEG